MAVGKGSMARASKAAAGKKKNTDVKEENAVLEVTAEKTEEQAVQPDVEEPKPKKKRTYTRKKKAEAAEKAMPADTTEAPKMEEPEYTEAVVVAEEENKKNTGRIAVGEEMPIYYY